MHSIRGARTWVGVAGAAALAAGAVMVATAPTSSAAVKAYTATAAPATVVAGVDTALTITLANTSDNRIAFGSANITVPTGLAVVGPPSLTANPGTVALVGGVLQVRNLNVQRGGSIGVRLTVRPACTGGVFTWPTLVKQSNDFNGTGNDFVNDGADPTTTVTGSCTLAFTGQPANAAIGAVISTRAFDPTAAPVRVEVRDGRATGAARVTWFTGTVSLAATGGDPGASLSGGAAKAATAGEVTFAPTLDRAESGYRLVASSPGLVPATSNAFVVGFGATVTCAANDGRACTTGEFPSPSGNTATITLNDADQVNATLEAQFDGRTFQCPEYTATSDALVFTTVSSNPLTGLTKTVVMRQSAVPGKTAADYQVCFEAPDDFPAFLPSQLVQDFSLFDFAGNTTPAVVNGQTVYRGLLLPCAAGAGVPCVKSRTVAGGVATIAFDVKAADPGGRF